MGRIVRCTIEMEFIEGEHFNPSMRSLSNEAAIAFATEQFLDTINQLDDAGDLTEYVQCKIVEELT